MKTNVRGTHLWSCHFLPNEDELTKRFVRLVDRATNWEQHREQNTPEQHFACGRQRCILSKSQAKDFGEVQPPLLRIRDWLPLADQLSTVPRWRIIFVGLHTQPPGTVCGGSCYSSCF